MAQIHALTPEGRLPSQAQAHAAEIADEAVGGLSEVAYQNRGTIGSAHLDTVTDPGAQMQQSTGNATEVRGYPAQSRGFAFTIPERGGVGAQFYVATWTGQIFLRESYGMNYGEWVEVTNTALAATVQALSGRVDAVEAMIPEDEVPLLQGDRTRHITSDYRPDTFAVPEGTVSYWTGPSGVERIPWTYKGEGYVGRIGDAAGYTTMQVRKVQADNRIDVSCLNPTTGRHITHRIQGTDRGDDQRRFEEAWTGTYTGTTVNRDFLIMPYSNIEWAFEIIVNGNDQFAPFHSTSSCRAVQYGPATIADGTGTPLDIDSLPIGAVLENVRGLKLRQRLYITHPDSGATRWAAVDEVRTITPDGMIQSEAVMTFLRDTTIDSNYGTMTPVAPETFDQLHILGGATYPIATTPPATTSYTDITEGHDATSALFTSTSNPDVFVAMAFLDPDATLARGDAQEDTSNLALRLEERSNGLVKLYPQSYARASVLPAGTVWRVGAQWRYGETANPAQYA